MGFTPNHGIDDVKRELSNIAKYGLKKSGTLAEAAASITISKDSNNNNINLKRAKLFIYIPAVAGAASLRIQCNGISDAKYYDKNVATSAASVSAMYGFASTLYGAATLEMFLIGGNIEVDSSYNYSSNVPALVNGVNSFLLKDGTIAGITSITLFINGGTQFPIGTTYQLYGEAVS